jgi:hypothetical protein
MSREFHPLTDRKAGRRAFVALALLALSIVLARPICDAYEQPSAASQSAPLAVAQHDAGESAHHSDESGPCCASVDEAALVASAIPVPTTDQSPLLIPTAPLALRPSVVSRRAALHPPQPPPRTLSFHARSARILV